MKKYLVLVLFIAVFGIVIAQSKVIDVVLIGGQSNATGQGIVDNLPRQFVVDEAVWIFYSKYLNKGVGSMQWKPLCPAAESEERFGFELPLGGALHTAFPERKWAIIKHGLSGSNLFKQWNPGNRAGETRGEEYAKFIETVQQGLSDLRRQGYCPILRAMVWQQGEGDSRFDSGMENSRAYGVNLKNFIEQVRGELKSPNMLFVFGVVMPIAAERFTGRDEVRTALRQIAASSNSQISMPLSYAVECDDLQLRSADYRSPQPTDDVHLGTFGILVMGERFAEVIANELPKLDKTFPKPKR